VTLTPPLIVVNGALKNSREPGMSMQPLSLSRPPLCTTVRNYWVAEVHYKAALVFIREKNLHLSFENQSLSLVFFNIKYYPTAERRLT
jgi:hypothetical protein